MTKSPFVRVQKFIDRTSFMKIILGYIVMILLFSLVFFAFSFIPGHGLSYQAQVPIGKGVWQITDSIYFSFITATSTGYGDLVPHGFSRVFAVIEVFGGLLIFGIIISKFVSVKQETILEEIYDISFDEKINRLRSALYLYRTDSNRFLERAKSGTMTQREVDDLWTHFTSLSTNLADIVKTIRDRAKEHTKSLDPFDLELLLNSVDLSLNKTYRLVSLLIEKGHRWKTLLTVQHLENIMRSAGRIIEHEKNENMSTSTHAKLAEMKHIVDALKAVVEGRAQPLGYRRLQDFGTKREGR